MYLLGIGRISYSDKAINLGKYSIAIRYMVNLLNELHRYHVWINYDREPINKY